jgi:alpha-amylase
VIAAMMNATLEQTRSDVQSFLDKRRFADRPKYVGDGHDILLQAFHWHSHRGGGSHGQRRSWYRIIQENADRIRNAGFTLAWFPPSSDSLSSDGYLPRRWNVLDTPYGNRGELKGAIESLGPVRALADVVLNHRVGVATPGVDFEEPRFPDNHAAVTCDDNSGQGRGRPDSGELCEFGRDLDHHNHGVRETIHSYLRMLQDVGFRGWRYDLVKGFASNFVRDYNLVTEPEFSVGEYFDGDRQKLANWIDGTAGKSAAFDFPLRFALYEACRTDEFGPLRTQNAGRNIPCGLLGFWSSHTVTFVDNHDTEYRREGDHQREQKDIHHFAGKSVAMAYAYTLTHPGVPCVFWSHFFDWDEYTRHRVTRLIQLRKYAGVHSRSSIEILEARKGLYAAIMDGRMAVKLGTQSWWPGHGWQLGVDGDRFAVWTRVP